MTLIDRHHGQRIFPLIQIFPNEIDIILPKQFQEEPTKIIQDERKMVEETLNTIQRTGAKTNKTKAIPDLT